jgi:hypothetical protein
MPTLTDEDFEVALASIAHEFGFETERFRTVLQLAAVVRRGPSEASNQALADLKKMKE